MYPLDREAFNKLVDQAIEDEMAHPCPGRHVARWARIKEIDQQLKAINAANAHKKVSKHEIPYHETDEWKQLVHEGTLLEEIERTQAMNNHWPIWQRHQHFLYLDANNELRQAEVITFNLEIDTIECTSWPRFDFQGYVSAAARQAATVSIQQLYDAERRLAEIEIERERLAATADLERQRTSLPLLAALLT